MSSARVIKTIERVLPNYRINGEKFKFLDQSRDIPGTYIYVQETKEILEKLISINKITVRLPIEKFSLASIDTKERLLYINDGASRTGRAPSEAMSDSYRGLRLIEGLWLITTYPEILEKHSIDLIGSKYSIECVPTIYKWENTINLSAICPDVSDKMCGAPFVIDESYIF